jgi:hypothetical protein
MTEKKSGSLKENIKTPVSVVSLKMTYASHGYGYGRFAGYNKIQPTKWLTTTYQV